MDKVSGIKARKPKERPKPEGVPGGLGTGPKVSIFKGSGNEQCATIAGLTVLKMRPKSVKLLQGDALPDVANFAILTLDYQPTRLVEPQ